jgi:hypothetical protein
MTPWRAGRRAGTARAARRGWAAGGAALPARLSAHGRRRQTERARRPAPRSRVGAAAARSGGGPSPLGLREPAAIGRQAGERTGGTRPALLAPAVGGIRAGPSRAVVHPPLEWNPAVMQPPSSVLQWGD